MIIAKYPYIDESGAERRELVEHYSDKNVYIRQVETGIEYSSAVDVYPCNYTYEETDKPIDETDVPKSEEDCYE